MVMTINFIQILRLVIRNLNFHENFSLSASFEESEVDLYIHDQFHDHEEMVKTIILTEIQAQNNILTLIYIVQTNYIIIKKWS